MNQKTLEVLQCINKHFAMYGAGCTHEEISYLMDKPVVDILIETTRLKIDKKIDFKWDGLRKRSLFYPAYPEQYNMDKGLSDNIEYSISGMDFVVVEDDDLRLFGIPKGCAGLHPDGSKVLVRKIDWPGVRVNIMNRLALGLRVRKMPDPTDGPTVIESRAMAVVDIDTVLRAILDIKKSLENNKENILVYEMVRMKRALDIIQGQINSSPMVVKKEMAQK